MAKMDEMKRRKFQRLNSPEMYKAVACLWAFGICLLSTFLAFKWGIEFVAWAIAPVGLIALFCGGWYYARSEIWLYDEAYAEYENEEYAKDEGDNEPPAPPIAHSEITPRPTAQDYKINADERKRFYEFVRFVYSSGRVGENTFLQLGFTRPEYRSFTSIMLESGALVKPQKPGQPYIIRGSFDEALGWIEEAAKEQTREHNYWAAIGIRYTLPSPIPVGTAEKRFN